MSKTWIVLGIVILLLAGFLWFRGSKQAQTPTNVTYDNVQTTIDTKTEPPVENVTPLEVTTTSPAEQDIQVVDAQIDQLGTDSTSIDESMK